MESQTGLLPPVERKCCVNCTNHDYIAKLIHPKSFTWEEKALLHDPGSFFLFSPVVWNYHQTVNQRHCVFMCWPLNVKGLDCYWVKLPKEARDRPWMKTDYYSDGFSCNVNVKFLSVHCVTKQHLHRSKTKTSLKRNIIILFIALPVRDLRHRFKRFKSVKISVCLFRI